MRQDTSFLIYGNLVGYLDISVLFFHPASLSKGYTILLRYCVIKAGTSWSENRVNLEKKWRISMRLKSKTNSNFRVELISFFRLWKEKNYRKEVGSIAQSIMSSSKKLKYVSVDHVSFSTELIRLEFCGHSVARLPQSSDSLIVSTVDSDVTCLVYFVTKIFLLLDIFALCRTPLFVSVLNDNDKINQGANKPQK